MWTRLWFIYYQARYRLLPSRYLPRFHQHCAMVQYSTNWKREFLPSPYWPWINELTNMLFQPNSRPVIKAAPSFVGLGVITTNPYIPGGSGAQWVCAIIGIEY